MKRNVDVNVTGIHQRPGEPTEKVITNAIGLYEEFSDGSVSLEYDEDLDDGKISVHNTVLIASDGKSMDIIRGGGMNSKLSFGEDMEVDTEYQTPYGSMNMRVKTSSFDYSRNNNDQKIKVVAEYLLSMEGQVLSESMIVLEIKNAETS